MGRLGMEPNPPTRLLCFVIPALAVAVVTCTSVSLSALRIDIGPVATNTELLSHAIRAAATRSASEATSSEDHGTQVADWPVRGHYGRVPGIPVVASSSHAQACNRSHEIQQDTDELV